MSDIVLPATMFMEHDDIYTGGGHQHLMFGPKLIDPPGECRSNHDVVCSLAARLGAKHKGFSMSPREHVDRLLRDSQWGTLADFEAGKWIDCQRPFEEAHYLDGFHWPDKKFRFRPVWPSVPFANIGLLGPAAALPGFPDHWAVNEAADAAHPFKLATSPARSFLNSSFNETPSSRAREGRPCVFIHPDDAAAHGIADGARVALGNERGEVRLHAKLYKGVQRGVLISEGLWPNDAFEGGQGINTLTGADSIAPFGGAAFHDIHVWARAL